MNNLISSLPWDVKNTIDKVKNAVMNYTEMEAKVREATNNDAWGASSTLLTEIARGTQNYQNFNEIMPMIYKRFAENQKNWRQIYKSLQLMEYLLKNGSDRVIDNVRDHLYEVKGLENFQFIDEKGKDQGINVRHRAKEIVELVNDNERLKYEREKAQKNKNKYQGVASEEVRSGGFGSSGNKYGGFSSSDYSSTSSGGNEGSNSYSSVTSPAAPVSNPAPVSVSTTVASATITSAKPRESNLLDFDFSTPAPAATFNAQPVAQVPQADFANFQSAPIISAPPAFANFQSAPIAAVPSFSQQQQQPSQFGMNAAPVSQAAPSTGGWSAFSAAPVQQQPQQQASFSANFSQFTSAAPIAPMTSTATPLSASTAAPKSNDIWSSNLVSLDSLGKAPVAQKAPALNQLAVTNGGMPPQPAANISSASSMGFSAFQAPSQQQSSFSMSNGMGTVPVVQQQQPFGSFVGVQSVPSASAAQQPRSSFGAFPTAFSQPAQPSQQQSQSNNNNFDLLM